METQLIWKTVAAVGIFGTLAAFYKYRQKSRLSDELEKTVAIYKRGKDFYQEAMLVYDKYMKVRYANFAARDLFGLFEGAVIDVSDSAVGLKLDTKEPKPFFSVVSEMLQQNKGSVRLSRVLLAQGGKLTHVTVQADKRKIDEEEMYVLVVDVNPSADIEAQHRQKDATLYDPVTNLPNRQQAIQDLTDRIRRAHRNSETFFVAVVSIDRFEQMQTTIGYSSTIHVFKLLAGYLKEQISESAPVYKMDCEKFLLILPSMQREEIEDILKKTISDIARLHKQNDTKAHLTVSIGVSAYPKEGENATKLLDRAYTALDVAKKQGSGSYAFYSDEFEILGAEASKLVDEIKAGLQKHEFFLYYQPIFGLKTEEMVGAEALLRWKHPKHGIVPAETFLDVASKSGLIVELGEYAFKEAVKQRRLWDEKGIKRFKITLNLSLREMQVEKLVQKIETVFDDYKVDPAYFNIDISESDAMRNIEKTRKDFELLKSLGLSLSIDHYGIGRSSIKTLQELPLSMLKIDRSLVADLPMNVDNQIVIKAIIEMIHSLGYEVVAEGVETSKETAILFDFGCDYAQGYLFSKPMPAIDLEELLRV